jgi:hypothetical protein
MYLLLDVSSTAPETNLDCDCAVVQLSESLCNRLQRLAEAIYRCRQQLPDLHEAYFWRFGVEYYACDLIDARDEHEAGWSERFRNAGRALLPNGVDLANFQPQRVECQQEIVRYVPAASNIIRHPDQCFEFAWTASPKHSDLYITTRPVTLQALRGYLAARKPTPVHRKRRRKARA